MDSTWNPADWILRLARRALYSVVRTQVFPPAIGDLGLDPQKPICYVLQHRLLSNYLVLREEARRAGLPAPQAPLLMGALHASRSFFFMGKPRPQAASARERYRVPPLLSAIAGAALGEHGADLQIVPVTILWGRAPDKQNSLLKALFAETWRPATHLRQLFAVLIHGRHTLVRFGSPLSARELVAHCGSEAQAARKLSRLLRVHFRRQREMAIGPDLSHRNTQVLGLLASPSVRAAIDAEIASGAPPREVADRARRYALEIASDYNYGVVRAFSLFLDWLWNRLYDGIEVSGFEAVAEIAPGSGIVYAPCHRSHIDYLLLSYVIFHRGMMPPHIAAGANLNIPVVGPLLRRGGAFFLRRQIKGNPLYAAVFDEYLHRMLSHGFPIEYFIEGGRSRSGRTLAPKTGLLGMTVKSFVRSHERPLFFVPVYVGYEKLVEGESFVGELAGKAKQKESLWGVLRTAKRLRHEFGRVHVNFGRPMELGAFLDTAWPNWKAGIPREDLLRATTRRVAVELVRRINEAVAINPVNLVALALLASPKHTLDEGTLYTLIAHYQALLTGVRYSVQTRPCTLDPGEVVAAAARLGTVESIEHPLGRLWHIAESQAALLPYFRNNTLHVFALPSLVACLLAHNSKLSRQRIEAVVVGLYGFLQPELFLRWTPPEIPAVLDTVLDVMATRRLVETAEDNLLAAPPPASQEAAQLRLIGETMRPSLERHFLTLALLQRHGSGRLTRRALEETSHLLAQRFALLYEFDTPEFSEKSLFAGVVANLIQAGLLTEDSDGMLHFDDRVTAPAEHAELLLPAEVRQTIRRTAHAV